MNTAKVNMGTKHTYTSFLHKTPLDMQRLIDGSSKLKIAWQESTPLARNEWICWVESVKKAETRAQHLARFATELPAGKRRPCCWPGCPHRRAQC